SVGGVVERGLRMLLLYSAAVIAAVSPVVVGAPPVARTPLPPLPKAVAAKGEKSAVTPMGTYVTGRVTAAMDAAQAGDMKTARGVILEAFAVVVSYGTDRDGEAFRQAAFARRLISSLEAADAGVRQELVPYLRAHD